MLTALESSRKSVGLLPDRWQACWNHALAMTWAGMQLSSAREWKRCGTLAGLRPEVVRIATTANPAPATTPEATRDYTWTEALPQWARAAVALDSGPVDTVRLRRQQLTLDSLTVQIERVGSDFSVAAVTQDIQRATSRRDTARARQIARAVLHYVRSRSATGVQNPIAALAWLDSAARIVGPNSALRPWVELESRLIACW